MISPRIKVKVAKSEKSQQFKNKLWETKNNSIYQQHKYSRLLFVNFREFDSQFVHSSSFFKSKLLGNLGSETLKITGGSN